jgi:DNA polymerase/3'-5' exonuclease PolX
MPKTKYPYAQVYPIAQKIEQALSPYFYRQLLVGSLRRQCADIGDIEFVCIPKPAQLSLTDEVKRPYLFEAHLANKVTFLAQGDKLQRFIMTTKQGLQIQVELWLQNHITWGANTLIRTGSARFGQFMVTPESINGAIPVNDLGQPLFYCRDARWYCGITHELIPTPEEEDVFKLLNIPYVPPHKRVGWGVG